MDGEDWLLLDMSYLANRALYSTGQLGDEKGRPTGVLFGIFRDIKVLTEGFNTDNVCYCFDTDTAMQKRQEIFPDYKKTRRERHLLATAKERKARKGMKEQLTALRTSILPKLNIKNIYHLPGFEADDLISLLCAKLREEKRIIVSADQDMYQLLDDQTIIYNPQSKKPYTAGSLMEEYGIAPKDWVIVKAIAGCSTDDVPGVKGVGEITAAKFLTGPASEKPKTPTENKINEFLGSSQYATNLRLVQLPYEQARVRPPFEEKIDKELWEKVMDEYGMKSLVKPRTDPITGGFDLGI